MRNTFVCVFAFLFSTLICSDTLFAQGKKRGNPYAEGENIYKHYTGSIGKRKVVLDLVWGYQGGSNYGGSYYYFTDSPVVYHMSILEPATFEHTEKLHGIVQEAENPWNQKERSFSDANVTWDFHIHENTLTGIYRDKSSGAEEVMYLEETYGKSIAFDIVIGRDNASISRGDGTEVRTEVFTMGITPSPRTTNITEMDFINKELLKFAHVENIQAEYIADYYKAIRVNFIKAAKIYFTKLFASGNEVNAESTEYLSYSRRMLMMRPVYNDQGFLTIQKSELEGNTLKDSYVNLDLVRTKKLEINDVLKVNQRWLIAMIENEFRKKYELSNAGKLSQWLTMDVLPMPQNFSLTHQGLIFYYDKNLLLKDKTLINWERYLSVYLTYNQLSAMLTKDFAERLRP